MNEETENKCREITIATDDLKNLLEEIEFEIKEYCEQVNDEFTVLTEETVFKIILVLKMLIGSNKKGFMLEVKTPREIARDVD